MSTEYSQKDVQVIIVCSVVSVLVIYYSLTYWIPRLLQWVRIQWERKEVLSVIQEEVGDHTISDISAELKNYRHVKAETNKPTVVRRKPNFAFGSHLTTASAPKEKAQPLNVHATRASPSSMGSSGSAVLSGAQPSQRRVPATSDDSSASVRPKRQNLSTFAEDSVESRLHQAFIQPLAASVSDAGGTSSGNSALHVQRALREQQDAEFRAAEQRDIEKQRKEQARQERLQRVAERRQFLANAVPPEPQGTSNDKIITLQFRFRETSVVSSHNTAGRSRITRRFSVTRHTAADLLHFVESLELRPLLSGAYELTLDYPTRVVSSSTEGSKTLEEMNITTDSVVWVTFSAD